MAPGPPDVFVHPQNSWVRPAIACTVLPASKRGQCSAGLCDVDGLHVLQCLLAVILPCTSFVLTGKLQHHTAAGERNTQTWIAFVQVQSTPVHRNRFLTSAAKALLHTETPRAMFVEAKFDEVLLRG